MVAGIGVTPAMAAVRALTGQRPITVAYAYRGAAGAYLDDLRAAAASGRLTLIEHDSARAGRLEPQGWLAQLEPWRHQPVEVIVCGPEAFNAEWQQHLQQQRPGWQVRLESFAGSGAAAARAGEPGAWRLPAGELAERRVRHEALLGPEPEPIAVGARAPAAEARALLQWFQRERRPDLDLEARCALAQQHLAERDCWPLSRDELGFGAQLAWRQAERCVGRRYWQGLDLRDHRDLRRAPDIAEALFDHLRFAYNGGDLRPAISVFDPGERGRVGPRIWNPQLLRYAGYRTSTGRQVGDPAQNALTARLMQLGWRPSGGDFELLPLVIETAAEGPCLFELPPDCRHEVRIRHGRHPWLEQLGLRWYAVPAVSDMALDLAGVLFRCAPFNGWYLDTEIAARNFSDTNRFNLLPRLAEGLGLDLRDERSLWRDRAQLVLAEAVLQSFDEAGVKISDHHTIGHEFLDFCRQEQQLGREPQAEWSWMVPPIAGSLSVLYQEPFSNRALKPAYVAQDPAWQAPQTGVDPVRRCPFSA
ncbi:MAG: nitric oxide synthase oxygenase [Cyanobacteria bacterium K_DeepCast_35m_m2_023]|nr:nitric oxide synthase oxygenase [Cyanobacteria bacterium K_DeepCast_35m_m2_023]